VGSLLKTWHRIAGLFAAAFLLILTVTGLLLMQTNELDLDSRYVTSDPMLDWYGIRPAPPPLTFEIDGHWITQLGSRLYFDESYLLGVNSQLIGAMSVRDEILVATTGQILLLTADGEIAERFDESAGLPQGLTHLGSTPDGTIVLKSLDGQFRYDPDSAHLQATDRQLPVHWKSAGSAPSAMLVSINHAYRGSGLTLERILLDLHTGRLFGPAGVALINIASILLLMLIFSGIVLWISRARGNGPNGSND
jgi:hypothetical protein